MTPASYDVVIVGGSLAGATAATLFGRRGLRVALIERSPAPTAYKTTCTHYIQPSAIATLRRLGLAKPIEEAGGVRSPLDVWTPHGWVRHPGEEAMSHGYNLRRERLDPLVRELAAATDGVEIVAGVRAAGLVEEEGRIVGVRVAAKDRSDRVVRGRLVVAADGRTSDIARMAGVPALKLPHRRFAYWTYFRDLPASGGPRSRLWFLNPEVAYALPTDDGITLIAYWDRRGRLDEYRGDKDASIRARWARLPDAPSLADGEQVAPWLGKLDMPNIYRRASHRGIALVGDAAQASDPLWGVGCGWAFQTAEWLVEATAPALARDGDLARALHAYRRRHRRNLLPHHLLMSEYSTARPFLPVERLIFAAAARDDDVAQRVLSVTARLHPAYELLSPGLMARACGVLVRGALGRRQARPRSPRSTGGNGLGQPVVGRDPRRDVARVEREEPLREHAAGSTVE